MARDGEIQVVPFRSMGLMGFGMDASVAMPDHIRP